MHSHDFLLLHTSRRFDSQCLYFFQMSAFDRIAQTLVMEAMRTRTTSVGGKSYTLPPNALLIGTHRFVKQEETWQHPMPRMLVRPGRRRMTTCNCTFGSAS